MKFIILLIVFSATALSLHAQDDTVAPLDTLTINLKDRLFFEVEQGANNQLTFTKVDEIKNVDKTITIESVFTEGSGTMLKIFNPFKKQLVYKAELYSFKNKEFIETSTVPVYPGISSFETWPYRIERMRLTGFMLTR